MKYLKFKTGFWLIIAGLLFSSGVFGQSSVDTSSVSRSLLGFWNNTGLAHFDISYGVMILVGIAFIYMGIARKWEPLLLVPIGFGMIVGNIPFAAGLNIGVYEQGSVMNQLYQGVAAGWYPSLIFLGIGAITDFSSLISNPKLILIGAAAQLSVFVTLIGAYLLGFSPAQAGAIGIIGGGFSPTAIFLSSRLAPELLSAIAVAACFYTALSHVIQSPVLKLMTTKKERLIRMKQTRQVTKFEKIAFPIVGLLLTTFIAPAAMPLLGMLFFGNLLKESGVTERLADTVRGALVNVVAILLGLSIGASAEADKFLNPLTLKIMILGLVSVIVATIGAVLFAKLMNIFLKEGNKVNPLIGSIGFPVIPDSGLYVQKYDKNNHLRMYIMASNVAGVIGSAVVAGILLSMLS